MKRAIAAVWLSCACAGSLWAGSSPGETLVYVGTYTGRGSEGIYLYRLDSSTGALTYVGTTTGLQNPSFLVLGPQGRCLYAVRESGAGAVVALSRDRTTGALTVLNEQPAQGQGPCHLAVDRTGRFLFVANYGSGSVAVLPIAEDGSLRPATSVMQHEGSSVNRSRQRGPHAHCVVPDATNRYLLVADLGIDKVMVYRFDDKTGKLSPNDPPFAQCEPGSGPRHIAFHPNGKYVYVIEEMSSTIEVFAWDAPTGELKPLQRISTLPGDFQGASTCAEIEVHPSGRFLYGSNRGHNSIACFVIDDATGKLTLVGHEPTQGKNPRHFAIDPSGTLLLAANQDSDSVVSFRISQNTGILTPTGPICRVSLPVCLAMVTNVASTGAAGASTDAAFLHRPAAQRREQSVDVDLSTATAHYSPLFGAGDSDSGVVKGIERFGKLEIEPGGASALVSYADVEGIFFILAGRGRLHYGTRKVPVKENDFLYLPPGVKYGISNSSNQPLRLLVMGYRVAGQTQDPSTSELMIANTDDVRQQVLGAHGPTTQFKLLMGTTRSRRDKLAAAQRINSLFLMDFAPAGTNNPHRHAREEEIYYVLRGRGDMVAGTDPDGKEMRYPAGPGDAFYFAPGTLIGFYSSAQEGQEHAQILAVRSACPAPDAGTSGDAGKK
jgi:6-phosphogluconolactonase